MVSTHSIVTLEQSIVIKCLAGLCLHAPFTPIWKHPIWKVAVIRSHVLMPYAEFQSSRPCHLLLHANYVLILFEYLLQIYKASVIVLAPGYTVSGIEVYKQKTHVCAHAHTHKSAHIHVHTCMHMAHPCAHTHAHTHNPPCHGKENKPRASYDILFFWPSGVLGISSGRLHCTNTGLNSSPHVAPHCHNIHCKINFSENLEDVSLSECQVSGTHW